jgi:hypothetical protein
VRGLRGHAAVPIVLLAPLIVDCGCDGGRHTRTPSGVAQDLIVQNDPYIEIRNTHLRVTDHARLEVYRLRGQTLRTREDAPVFFDQPDSFMVRIEEAEVALTEESLSALLNEWVFAYPDAPLRDLEAEIGDDLLTLHGELDKLIPLPFTIEGTLAVTEDGNLRLTPTSIQAAGLPVAGLMELLDVEMVELIDAEEARGVRVDGNDVVLLTSGIVPPPRILGRVVAVDISDGRLGQRLAPPANAPDPPGRPPTRPGAPDAPNYLHFAGGVVRFGHLTMRPTDLQIADADPDDPFDFYLGRLDEQLVAGRSFTLSDQGLLTVLPDYDDLEERRGAAGGSP